MVSSPNSIRRQDLGARLEALATGDRSGADKSTRREHVATIPPDAHLTGRQARIVRGLGFWPRPDRRLCQGIFRAGPSYFVILIRGQGIVPGGTSARLVAQGVRL